MKSKLLLFIFFALGAGNIFGQPSCNNDYACSSPKALTISSSCVNSSCSTIGATPPSPNIPANCDANGTCGALYNSNRYDDDVWFTITPSTSNQVTIKVTPTSNLSNFDPDIFVYHGTCPSALTQDACACANYAGGLEQIVFSPTTNTTYLIRVFSYGIGSTYSGNFNICVTQQNPPSQYIVSVSASPSIGGSVSGGGTYNSGNIATISATANSGYTFINWTENGNLVSSAPNYTFSVATNRTFVANFSQNPTTYNISISASPSNGGSVSGGGNYNSGTTATVNATANSGYTFTNWTENGNPVSSSSSYPFTVTGNRTLVANFSQNPTTYNISVVANPTNGGSVSGGGIYNSGTTATINATANSGWNFVNWTENGNLVYTNASNNFTVNTNRTLVANFSQIPASSPDLIIQNPSSSINNLVAGSSAILSYSVKNIGNANAGQSYVSFHLSSDNIFQSGTDVFLVDTLVPSIASTGIIARTQKIRIPKSTSSGTWYILVSADGTNMVNESDETNNTSYAAINVTNCYDVLTDYYKQETPYNGAGDPSFTNCQNLVYLSSDVDVWSFYKYQCTSYSAFMVNKSWGYVYPSYTFNNTITSPNLSNAGNWANRLGNIGFSVNTIPSVGSIAWWDFNSPGIGSAGHVAFVNCITGNTITVSEYNFSPACQYNTRTLDLSQPNAPGNRTPDKFIHTEVGGLGGATSIYELLAESEISIFPNPTTGTFTISTKEKESTLIITNVLGEKILSQKIQNEKTEIDLSIHPNGIYFLTIKTEIGTANKKLIINK